MSNNDDPNGRGRSLSDRLIEEIAAKMDERLCEAQDLMNAYGKEPAERLILNEIGTVQTLAEILRIASLDQ